MRFLRPLLLGLVLATAAHAEQPKGLIAKTVVDGNTVIVKLVDELPDEATREALPWLVIITWKYDGSGNNGMPAPLTLDRMLLLEKTIEQALLRDGFLQQAYSRTGNHLKEIVYYANDREAFLAQLNAALAEHEAYPITIEFHEDAAWEDFRNFRTAVTGRR